MNAIKAENLTYVYSPNTPFEKAAIQDINLEIEQGEFVGVIGHTGSGKSTLIQHFNGLLKPTSGRIFINGTDLWADGTDRRAYRFKVGLVFQYPEYQLFEETVYKDIAFGPTNMGLSPAEVEQRVREAAIAVGLKPHHMEKSPFELSGGQKRRVAIAGVLAMGPDILILDEPTAGLDPKGREQILGMIKAYHRQRRNTILLVSHSMEDIARYANKVLVLNRSGVAMYDDVATVFSRAEEITRIGLSVPQITRIFGRLRAQGFPVSESVYTMDYAKQELLSLLAKGEKPVLKDITIGQYFPGSSPIHKLDPRVKILLTLGYIVVLFAATNPIGLSVGILFLVFAYGLSKIPPVMILKSLRPVIPIILFTSVLNMLFIEGDVIFQWWILRITVQGVTTAVVMSVRIICLIAGTSLLTYTTSPIALTDGIERLCSPLKRFKLPVHELAMMMTIALRFIPTLIEETDKIMSAQKARGADLESGGLVQRAKALIPILIPLFVSAFRRADELALAMECRCYRGGEGRTRMKQLKLHARDVYSSAFVLLCIAAVICINLFAPEILTMR